MKQNFFDINEGEWSDSIGDTYKSASLIKILEFPLMREKYYKSSFFNIFMTSILSPRHEGVRILDIIITENENIKIDIEQKENYFSEIYYINYNNVPLQEVIFILESGEEVKPSTSETYNKNVSFGVRIVKTKDPIKDYKYTTDE